MSRRNAGRDIDGLLLLDKSPGLSSNGAVQRAKRLFQANKVGHTGSLDPIATGLLPLCFGEAAKLAGFLLNNDKRYLVRMRLGKTTSTADTEGEVLEERSIPMLTREQVESHLDRFRGDIFQVPPMFSALKHQGRKLYELARKGIEVERKPRAVRVHELSLLEIGESHLDLDVHCSKGAYIRSLAVDLGEALGCGAHVERLRRTEVGVFKLEQAFTLEQLEGMSDEARQNLLIPLVEMAVELPLVELAPEIAFHARRGQAVFVPNAPTSGLLKLVVRNGGFLGVGEVLEDGRIAPRRLVKESRGLH